MYNKIHLPICKKITFTFLICKIEYSYNSTYHMFVVLSKIMHGKHSLMFASVTFKYNCRDSLLSLESNIYFFMKTSLLLKQWENSMSKIST